MLFIHISLVYCFVLLHCVRCTDKICIDSLCGSHHRSRSVCKSAVYSSNIHMYRAADCPHFLPPVRSQKTSNYIFIFHAHFVGPFLLLTHFFSRSQQQKREETKALHVKERQKKPKTTTTTQKGVLPHFRLIDINFNMFYI